MWGALILICSLDNTQCEQLSKGRLFSTLTECQTDIVEVGVPYVLESYPNHVPIDVKCVYWEILEPEA